MRVVIFSDTHGEWHSMYERALREQADVVLHCGDIETLRDENDLAYYIAPKKYKRKYMEGTEPFEYQYYYEQGGVPLLTFFIAGNHENWNYLYKYIQGPVRLINRFFYMGNYGFFSMGGHLNIAGLSKVHVADTVDYYTMTDAGERIPFRWHPKHIKMQSPKHAKGYHECDFDNLVRLIDGRRVDILLLHENPLSVFETGSKAGRIYGSKDIDILIRKLRPAYVFCGHMHFDKIDFTRYKDVGTVFVNIEKNGFFTLNW